MAAAFVPNQMFDAAITEEAPGHIFSAGTEPWLVQPGPLDCLRFCILSTGQANGCIIGHLFYEMISFTEIIPDKVQGIGESIMAATKAALSSNQPYWRLNNIKVLVHWCRIRHAMGFDLESRMFIVKEMSRCR